MWASFSICNIYHLSAVHRSKGAERQDGGGTDRTTLAPECGLCSIVRRNSSESYDEFLKWLAEELGISTPTPEQLAKLDRRHAEEAERMTSGTRSADYGQTTTFAEYVRKANAESRLHWPTDLALSIGVPGVSRIIHLSAKLFAGCP
jgi:O6-methylguanine-DNA--protein-cysteine methyltransferase